MTAGAELQSSVRLDMVQGLLVVLLVLAPCLYMLLWVQQGQVWLFVGDPMEEDMEVPCARTTLPALRGVGL